MLVPAFHSIELVLSIRPSLALRLAYAVRDLLCCEMRFQVRIVGMRHELRPVGEPMAPRQLGAVQAVLGNGDKDGLRWRRQRLHQASDVLVDLHVLEDVAVYLRECRVADVQASQQDHELDQVRDPAARSSFDLPNRLLRSVAMARDRIRVQIVVQRVVAGRRCQADFKVVSLAATVPQDLTHLAAESPTSSTRPPIFRSASCDFQRSSCGMRIHARRVLPSLAPTTMMPV